MERVSVTRGNETFTKHHTRSTIQLAVHIYCGFDFLTWTWIPDSPSLMKGLMQGL